MPNALGLLGEARMQATPRNKLMGLLADALTAANEYAQRPDPRMPGGKANPVLGLLADGVSLNSLVTTANRASYGEPLTNNGKANVPFMKPETADALMMAPLSPRNALAMMGAGMADNGMMKAATVWHGSPHKFDKFDASKIGTGEGAQAYGHGLYLAESPDVAKTYADIAKVNNSGQSTANFLIDGIAATPSSINPKSRAVLDAAASGALDKFINSWKSWPRTSPEAAALADSMIDAAIAMRGKSVKKVEQHGNMYKVDLPDEAIAKMLDWDKPLSQQAPEVRQTLADYAAIGGIELAPGMTGKQIYDAFGAKVAKAKGYTPNEYGKVSKAAADDLRFVGIPGIRYLDGGSRGAGSGSSNFVVFPQNEGLLKILERNGQPLK